MTRVLVVGGGGREHALVRALARATQAPEVLAAPGNPGIARDGARCLAIEATDVSGLVAAAVAHAVDLVVVGPEAPLVAGLVDALGEVGVRAFGPSAAAARIEGSKAYAKALMAEVGVPTAPSVVLSDLAAAREHLAQAAYPVVVKADVLAAGKGVAVCPTELEARAALEELLVARRFGHTRVVVESFLEGEEVSLLALCDGRRAVAMAPARDFKRIGEGDEGPNTGGMGSYSPVAELDEADADALADVVHQPVVNELRRRGTPFHGVLYAGLMLTPDGPRVLEYNCRFGDPETQAVLPRLGSDLLELLLGACTFDGLDGVRLRWTPQWAVTVVLASAGYPASSSSGDPVEGIEDAEALGAEVLHAGTAERDGALVTAGGRVLNVTGLGPSPAAARERAYAGADRIHFNGKQMRRDVAARALEVVRT